MPTLQSGQNKLSAPSGTLVSNELSEVLFQLQLLSDKFDNVRSSQGRVEEAIAAVYSKLHQKEKQRSSILKSQDSPKSPKSPYVWSACDFTDDITDESGSWAIKQSPNHTSIMKVALSEKRSTACSKPTFRSSGQKSNVSQKASTFGKTSTMLREMDDDDEEVGYTSHGANIYEERFQRLQIHNSLKCNVSMGRVTKYLSDNQIQRLRGSAISNGTAMHNFSSTDSRSFRPLSLCSCITDTFPLSPDSRIKLFFDFCSMFMLLNDSIMVPFMIAWEKKLEGFFWFNAWVTVLFWSFDVLLHFATCVIENDMPTRSWSTIASHYIKGWFPVDVCVISFDWISILVEMATDGDSGTPVWVKMVRLLKASRMLRILEMIKSGRFAQVSEMIIQKAREKGIGANVYVMLRMSKMVALILWMSHVGSCLWYGAIMNNITWSDTCLDWKMHIQARFSDEESCGAQGSVDSLSERFYYLTGLYWSVTSMFSGASFLVPANSSEAIFAIAFVVFGMLFSSCVVSSLAATLIDFEMMMRDHTVKMRTLQNFLHQHKINPSLCVNVQSQIRARLMVEKRITEDDVEVITLLSTELRSQLRANLCQPSILTHEILGICYLLHEPLIRSMCDHCISHIPAKPGTILFLEQVPISHCWLLVTGSMQYTTGGERELRTTAAQSLETSSQPPKTALRESGVTEAGGKDSQEVNGPHWVCEIALWSHWASVGSVEASDSCELLKINVEKFAVVLAQCPLLIMVMKDYGSALIDFLQNKRPVNFNDMQLGIDHDWIVSLMDDRSRVAVSQPALETIKAKADASFTSRTKKGLEDLQKEVEAGACHLRHDDKGKLLRVAQVVAVKLSRQDDKRMLVQLGEWKDGKPSASVKLPGTKMRCVDGPDGPEKSVHRLLAGVELSQFLLSDTIHFECQEVELSISEAYHIQSKYVRTVYSASLSSGITKAELTKDFACCCDDESKQTVEIESFVTLRTDDMFISNCKFWAWIHPEDYDSVCSAGQQVVCAWMEDFSSQFFNTRSTIATSISNAQHSRRGGTPRSSTRSTPRGSTVTHDGGNCKLPQSDGSQHESEMDLLEAASKPLETDMAASL